MFVIISIFSPRTPNKIVQILVLVIRQRNKVIEETDQKRQGDESDLEDDAQKKLTPSVAAISQFLDYCK